MNSKAVSIRVRPSVCGPRRCNSGRGRGTTLALLASVTFAACSPSAGRTPVPSTDATATTARALKGTVSPASETTLENPGGNSVVPSWVSPVTAAGRERMEEIRQQITALQLPSLDKQGTIDLRGVTLQSGIHVLRSTCGQQVATYTATCTTTRGTLPVAVGATPVVGGAGSTVLGAQASTTGIASTGAGGPLGNATTAAAGARQASQSVAGSASTSASGQVLEEYSVTRYTGASVSDVAVILADKVVFDHATVTLSDAVRELWIVAETIESEDSVITWSRASSPADPITGVPTCGGDGNGYNPHQLSTGSHFTALSGSDGSPGHPGSRGNDGVHAPDVFVYLKRFTDDGAFHVSLPAIQVQGQQGGAGQPGQCGGDGGDGAKGADARQDPFNCAQGPGHGGDGGDGADGSSGGLGGPGGDGGNVYIHFVELPNVAVQSSIHNTAGGRGGGGPAGQPGRGGEGGDEGEGKWPYCVDAPERAGSDGADGATGRAGVRGADGDTGDLDWILIGAAEWEAAFTAPYLQSASPTVAFAGESFTLQTLNVTGVATVTVDDEYSFSAPAMTFPLVSLGGGAYRWSDTSTTPAGKYLVTVTRQHDGRVTENAYSLEIKPVIEQVSFTSPFDAVYGGTARILGKGLRDDATIVLDGTDIGRGTFTICSVSCPIGMQALAFTIPVTPTDGLFFVRDDGVTPHTVFLDQPYPLANSDRAEFLLKRQAGLTFRPSVNGYPFDNGTLTAVAKIDANANPWQNFRETYGGLEVDAANILFAPMVGVAYAGWRGFWAARDSALCTGISSSVLADYFQGATGINNTLTGDVAHTVMVRQGKLLSQEWLGSLTGQTVLGASFTSGATVDKVTRFMETGNDVGGGDAPVMIMLPSVNVYLALVLATAITSFNPGNIQDAFENVVASLGDAHSLAPFNVVYANPADPTPARIYFYDSNYPNVDTAYMTVGNGGRSFTYDMFDSSVNAYLFSNANSFTLGYATVDFLHADVSMPLVPLP